MAKNLDDFLKSDPLFKNIADDEDANLDADVKIHEPGAPVSFSSEYGEEGGDVYDSDQDGDGYDEGDYEPRKRMGSGLKTLIYLVSVIGASILLAMLLWVAASDVLALTSPDQTIVVEINEGDSLNNIAAKLKESGLIQYKFLFQIYGKLTKAEEKIDPGTYELNNNFDYHALVVGMQEVSETRMTVALVIPEGYEQARIFELLSENGVASLEDLEDTAANYDFDYDFLAGLELGRQNRLEGYLFPDTYDFYIDEDPVSVINKFLSNFDRKFDADMKARIEELNRELRAKMIGIFTEEEIQSRLMDENKIVIIASLIEKEAANNAERPIVSSVIHNRLTSKLYPLLQIDATVQYVLEERKEVLTNDDLTINSPYNTYKQAGLPIGPIANPGLASLKAALYPADTNYYFYALDTDGTHHFSETSIEHEAFLNGLNNG